MFFASQRESGRKEDITPWLSGKHNVGEQFVYNKRLRWVDETEMGLNFWIEARWPGWYTLKPHRAGSISQEAGGAGTGHYSPWGLGAGIVGGVFRRSELKCLLAGKGHLHPHIQSSQCSFLSSTLSRLGDSGGKATQRLAGIHFLSCF